MPINGDYLRLTHLIPSIRAMVGLFLILVRLTCPGAESFDWPQFLGPHRNGVVHGAGLATVWPKDGPRVLWQKKIGQGFSGPVATSQKVILFHRMGNQEVVQCMAAADGAELWETKYRTEYQDDFGMDEGPRATPAIDGDRVYTFGAEGVLTCWSMTNGGKLWAVATKAAFHQRKGFFGIASSPLIEGDAVILNIGGTPDAGIVAFDKKSGRVLWKCTSDEASYASPVTATIDGRRLLFVITREALVAATPEDGQVLFRYPWRPATDASVSAASPLIVGNLIFISASYGARASVLRFRQDKPEKLWASDAILSNHYATSVHHNGLLFGFDGRQEQGCELRCVELTTGKIKWSEGGLKAGTVLISDGQLLVLTESGEILIAPAVSLGFRPTSRAQVLPFGVRAHPALSAGLLYARSKDKLACIELRNIK